jgi:PAS domain S-box-containing protein
MKKSLNYITFSLLFILPLLFYPSIDKSVWISSSDVHSMLEFTSSLLSITAGVMVLLYFYTSGRSLYLIISVGFFLVGAEEFIHALFSFSRIGIEIHSTFKLAVSTTWLSGQFLLATFFFLAFFSGEHKIESAKRGRYAIIFDSIGFLFASIVSLMIFKFPSLPEFVQPGSITKKLIELSLALLFFIAFILYLRIYTKQNTHNPLLWSILAFLIFGVLAHLFVFDSESLYDAHWDVAHLLVLLSNFFPIFGVWGESIKIHKYSKLQVIALKKEISKRKEIEETLSESEEKFRNLFNNSEVGMFRTRLDGSEILEFNKKYLKILGYTYDEVKGRPSRDMWADKHQREKIVQKLLSEGYVTDFECQLLNKQGGVLDCITSLRLYPETGIMEGSILDITDQKRDEKIHRISEERLRDIIFSMGDWVWEVDEKGIYTYSSLQGTNILGYSNAEIVGKTPFDFMPQDETAKVREILSEIMANKALIKDLENWNINKNGEMICLLTNGVPLLDNEGNLKGYRGVDKDITEFKKNETAIKNMNEMMSKLYQRLENIRENEQAQISRNIHDQLGQSLTSLKFDLGTLINQTESGSDEEVKLAGMIEMVTQIIKNVQRISSELRPPALDELGLSAAMEWYCEDFMERTGLQVIMELDDVQTKNMNKNLALYKVLQEALTNVIRHSSAENVLVKLCVSGKDILLIIKDDGIGITPDKIASFKSLGILGMFERIRQYGGDVEITNPDKKGTEVKVRLSI